VQNIDRSTVKHGTQNIQNDCYHWLSDSFRVHHICFRPDPLEQLTALPDPLAGLKTPLLRRRSRGGRGEGERVAIDGEM